MTRTTNVCMMMLLCRVKPAYVVGKRERVPGWLKRVFRDIRGRRKLTLARMKIIFK